jgi:hypothetical protein
MVGVARVACLCGLSGGSDGLRTAYSCRSTGGMACGLSNYPRLTQRFLGSLAIIGFLGSMLEISAPIGHFVEGAPASLKWLKPKAHRAKCKNGPRARMALVGAFRVAARGRHRINALLAPF